MNPISRRNVLKATPRRRARYCSATVSVREKFLFLLRASIRKRATGRPHRMKSFMLQTSQAITRSKVSLGGVLALRVHAPKSCVAEPSAECHAKLLVDRAVASMRHPTAVDEQHQDDRRGWNNSNHVWPRRNPAPAFRRQHMSHALGRRVKNAYRFPTKHPICGDIARR
jgi:hypothetical protein